jgi:hypothetical protein
MASEITITGTLPKGNTTRNVTYYLVDASRNTIVNQVVLPDAVDQNNLVSLAVTVPSATASYAIGTFDDGGRFLASTFLSVNKPASDQRTTGAVGR